MHLAEVWIHLSIPFQATGEHRLLILPIRLPTWQPAWHLADLGFAGVAVVGAATARSSGIRGGRRGICSIRSRIDRIQNRLAGGIVAEYRRLVLAAPLAQPEDTMGGYGVDAVLLCRRFFH